MRDPKAVWDKPRDTYKTTSEARVDAYVLQYHHTKMKLDETVMEYVSRLSEIESRLGAVGHTLTPK